MSVKSKLIVLFEDNRGNFLSGEEIAEKIGCTRGAVWKAVKSLQSDGYSIFAQTNKGYCLSSDTDILSSAGVHKYLDTDTNVDIEVFSQLQSTNLSLREYAEKGAPQGKIVISGMQTNGRGRLGRSFFSPSDTGLYMSILLRPNMLAADAVKITTAAAVAVAKACEETTNDEFAIKWVNDVYKNDRKICGILTEASFDLESGGLEYAVVGIGINAYKPENDFPEEIRNIAGAVSDVKREDLRNKLAGRTISYFMKYYADIENSPFYEDYKKRLMWANKTINVIHGNVKTPAVLLGCDKDCHLHVRYENGNEEFLSSGEITIRLA